MRVIRILLLAAAALTPLAALAQTAVVFTNNDGTFVFDNASQVLTLGQVTYGSTTLGNAGALTAISGLSDFGVADQAVSFPGCAPACLGSISLTTGALASGSILSSATFNPGGSINVQYGPAALMTSFTGTFSQAQWVASGTGTWTFIGTITGGTLMVNGSNIAIPDAVTVQLTLTAGGAQYHKNKDAYTITDSGGTTNFSVAPEPGTLALFGSGLIAIGAFTKRRLGARASRQ